MTRLADIAARLRQAPAGRVLPAAAAAALPVRPIRLGEMQARLLHRLEQGPALKIDLVATAYAGRNMPRDPESTVSVYLHRLAGMGFPLFISLGSGHVHLAPGGPAWVEKTVSRGTAVSRETGISRETIGSTALVEAVLQRSGKASRTDDQAEAAQ